MAPSPQVKAARRKLCAAQNVYSRGCESNGAVNRVDLSLDRWTPPLSILFSDVEAATYECFKWLLRPSHFQEACRCHCAIVTLEDATLKESDSVFVFFTMSVELGHLLCSTLLHTLPCHLCTVTLKMCIAVKYSCAKFEYGHVREGKHRYFLILLNADNDEIPSYLHFFPFSSVICISLSFPRLH